MPAKAAAKKMTAKASMISAFLPLMGSILRGSGLGSSIGSLTLLKSIHFSRSGLVLRGRDYCGGGGAPEGFHGQSRALYGFFQ